MEKNAKSIHKTNKKSQNKILPHKLSPACDVILTQAICFSFQLQLNERIFHKSILRINIFKMAA